MTDMGVGSRGGGKSHQLDHAGGAAVGVYHGQVLNMRVGRNIVFGGKLPDCQKLLGACSRCISMQYTDTNTPFLQSLLGTLQNLRQFLFCGNILSPLLDVQTY